MRNTATRRYPPTRFVLGILAASLCALPARAQFVSTVVTNNLIQPAGVAIDSSNNLYITDSGNNRVAIFVPSSGTLSTLAGSGTIGTNNGTGAAASFFDPQGIVAARGGLIVADQGSQLIRYVTFGGTVSTLAGQAYVAGEANGTAATATFSYPAGLAADSAGDLYVADTQNNVIRKIDTNNIVSTVATGAYTFNLPNAVAVDNNNNIWVADSGNNVICMISGGAVTVVAGISGQAGTNDSLTATSARFNAPSGLLWVPIANYLLIGDTGNDTIRSLFLTNFNGSLTYAVQTVAGLPGLPGFVNGSLAVAQFDAPVGLCVDPTDFGFYVADSDNNAVRVLQPTAPLPQITAPEIGYVSFPVVNGTPSSQFNDITGSSVVFNNPTIIAIQADPTTETYITYGPTGSVIPAPGPTTGSSPQIYTPGDNGLPPNAVPPTVVPTLPDLTIYAISEAAGRPTSAQVSTRIQYVTANPTINGNNAADILLTDITEGATMFYTTDGSSPTNDGSSGVGVGSGTVLSLNISSNVNLQVRAFESDFAPSDIVSTPLSISNVVGNQLTWGFSSGPASTHFITGLNLAFSAPVAYTQIPSSLEIYTLQLDMAVENNGPEPSPAFGFVSDLVETFAPPRYTNIPPGIYIDGGISPGIITTEPYTLETFWLVTTPVTNLYYSSSLLEQSIAADTLFGLPFAVVGTFSFVVPSSATPGYPYTLEISYPSASSYNNPFDLVEEQPINVFVQAPTNGPNTGTGPNAVKLVTVLTNNSPKSAHLVGDVEPFTWYNIGDFGDGLLLDNDVIQTMNHAGDFAFAGTPLFDAMDSSDGSTNNYYTASDSFIDTITTGDGKINVDDVYVTLRRSLDTNLTDYSRYWSGSSWVPTVYPGSVQQLGLKASAPSPSPSPSPIKLALNPPRYVTVAWDQVQAGGNLTVQVPIRVLAADTLPVRVFMFNVEIDPLDGSPPITGAVSFSAVTNLGSPWARTSQNVNNYVAAWLDSTVFGVSGTSLIGALTVTLPPNVNANSAYLVHFNHFSASPNGLALFHATVQDGLITVGNRTGSSWHDGIPDTWRLLYFGTVSNILSAANADPDGDGASNWQEFIAGTNPLDARSVFEFLPATPLAGSAFTLEWPSVVNKNYTLQSSSSPGSGWTTIASNLIGNSQVLQWTDTNASSGARFYRAQVQ
jgi:sugar lactone lactonase YvrE